MWPTAYVLDSMALTFASAWCKQDDHPMAKLWHHLCTASSAVADTTVGDLHFFDLPEGLLLLCRGLKVLLLRDTAFDRFTMALHKGFY